MAVVPGGDAHIRRRPPERVAAWLATGPPGHLYSVVADLAIYGLQRGRGGLARRLRRSRAGRRVSRQRGRGP